MLHYRELIPADDAAAIRALDDALSARQPYQLRFRTVVSGGQTRWLQAQAERLTGENGEPGGLIGTILDITELASAREEREQFAFGASHDLREPLRTVTNFTQLLARSTKGQLSPEAHGYLDYILEGTQRMRALVEGLAELAQASVIGGVGPVDCCRIIGQCGVDVACGELPVVQGDAARLLKLFRQLISNAARFRRPEGELRVEITAKPEPGFGWQFCVRDNGQGFDPAHAEAVFAPFRRLHGPGVSGSGLGLAICRRIVEAHGGRIWAEALPGEGASFFFTLPAPLAYS